MMHWQWALFCGTGNEVVDELRGGTQDYSKITSSGQGTVLKHWKAPKVAVMDRQFLGSFLRVPRSRRRFDEKEKTPG